MRALAVVCSAALLLAACGSGAPPATSGPSQPAGGGSGKPASLADIAAYQGADRQAILEEGAKKEGTVQYYTTLAGDVVQAIADRFRAKYPYLKVETYRGNGDELMTKISQEQAAKKYIVDVIHGDEDTVAQLAGAGYYVPFFSPNSAAFPADDRDAASGNLNYDVLNTVLYMSFAYNTKSLPENIAPKTYADLTNPALKGKMAITGTGNSGPRWIGTIIQAYNEDLVHKIAQQSFQVQMVAAKAVMDLISKGEVISSPTIYEDHTQQAQEAGAPVKWVPLEPVVGGFSGVGIVAGAQHPYASMLFMDWLLSPDFRKIQDDYHLGNPSANPGFKTARPTKGMNLADRTKNFQHWADLLKEFGK
jgi:iron(III) transport system substrate-binding protein